jgi:tetratricopeptide (TPR) repeat protein
MSDAIEKSRGTGKPILVDFQAPWCYSCYYMERRVLSGTRFADAAKGIILLKLDVDQPEGHALKTAYGVTFLPSYLVLSEQGKRMLGRIIGEQTEDDFLNQLAALSSGGRQAQAPEIAKLRSQVEKGKISALEKLLRLPADCRTPYDVYKGNDAIDALKSQRRHELLDSERRALESILDTSFFVSREKRCADFRSGIDALGQVYAKLGDASAAAALYSRAVTHLEKDGLKTGDDRSHDDNRRYFMELQGDSQPLRTFYVELIDAYPADYVYAYRYAKFLLGQGKHAEALPWIEKADKLAYGANRLAVTNVRAKILAALGRKDEALALAERDLRIGKSHFPKEAGQLQETLAGLRP